MKQANQSTNDISPVNEAQRMIQTVVNRFDDMTPEETYKTVHETITHLSQQDAEWMLALNPISNHLCNIVDKLPPDRAAIALDMVANSTPAELRRFLLTNFGCKKFSIVKDSMLSLNQLLIPRNETNRELNETLSKNQVTRINDKTFKNFRLFMRGLVGTMSVHRGRTLNRKQNDLPHNELSIRTGLYLSQLRKYFNSAPLLNTFSNFCPIASERISKDKGILVISYDDNDTVDTAHIEYYQNQSTFLRAWNVGSRCPMTRKKHHIDVPLSTLTEEQLLSLIDQNGELQTGAPGNTSPTSFAREFFTRETQQNTRQLEEDDYNPWSSDDQVIQLMIEDDVIGDGNHYEYTVSAMRAIIAQESRNSGRLRLMYSPDLHNSFLGAPWRTTRACIRGRFLTLRPFIEGHNYSAFELQPSTTHVIQEMRADRLIQNNESETHHLILLLGHENNYRMRRIFAPEGHPLSSRELRHLVVNHQLGLQQILDMPINVYDRLLNIYNNEGSLHALMPLIEANDNTLTIQKVLDLESLIINCHRLTDIYSPHGQARHYQTIMQDGLLSLQEILNLSNLDYYHVNNIYSAQGERRYLQPLIGNNKPFTLHEILELSHNNYKTLEDIYRYNAYPGIRQALSDKVVTFKEIFNLSEDYYAFFSAHYNSETNRSTLIDVIQNRGTDSLQKALEASTLLQGNEADDFSWSSDSLFAESNTSLQHTSNNNATRDNDEHKDEDSAPDFSNF